MITSPVAHSGPVVAMQEPLIPAQALRHKRDDGITSGLAWLSIAIGVTEIVAPDALARLIGLRPTRNTRTAMRAAGMRELTTGYGLLTHQRNTPWLWSRLAGEVLDLSLLGANVGRRADDRLRASRAVLAVGGVAAVNFYVAARSQGADRHLSMQALDAAPVRVFADSSFEAPGALPYAPSQRTVAAEPHEVGTAAIDLVDAAWRTARHTVAIECPAGELYAFWRNFEHLPVFMSHLDSVTSADDTRSHWVSRTAGGASVEWDTEIVADVPNELIAWQSSPDAAVQNAGTVRFVPTSSGRSTDVHLELKYSASAGALGEMVARLFRAEPGQQVEADLEAFKREMESGAHARALTGDAE